MLVVMTNMAQSNQPAGRCQSHVAKVRPLPRGLKIVVDPWCFSDLSWCRCFLVGFMNNECHWPKTQILLDNRSGWKRKIHHTIKEQCGKNLWIDRIGLQSISETWRRLKRSFQRGGTRDLFAWGEVIMAIIVLLMQAILHQLICTISHHS